MDSAKRSAAATQERILLTARTLFSEQGFAAVSVRDIAKAAGVTHPLVHRYFGSKEELISAVLAKEVERIAAGGGQRTATPEETIETVERSLRFGFTPQARDSYMLILRSQIDGFAPESLLDGASTSMRLIADSFSEHNQLPEGTIYDPRVISAMFVAMMFGLVATTPWIMSGVGLEDMSEDEFHAEVTDFMMNMLRRGAEAAFKK